MKQPSDLLKKITHYFNHAPVSESVKKECPFHMLIPGNDLDLLVFVGAYDPSKFKSIKNRNHSNKPDGGVWTSPFDPDKGSGWIEWCKEEKFRVPTVDTPITILKVNDDGKFLLINTLNDLNVILKDFGVSRIGDELKYYNPVLDYEMLAKVIDGIYLTSKGQWATHLTEPSLYGWDCETVLILNQKVISQTLPGKIEEKWIHVTPEVD